MPGAYPSSAFEVSYRADLDVLVGRWFQPLPDAQLRQTYQALLAEAQANGNCRFALLDIRRRDVASDAFTKWLLTEFNAGLPQLLGGPVMTAYLATPSHLARVILGNMPAALDSARQGGVHVRFFADESAALRWLRGGQGHGSEE
jgi:hypothetical protein